MAEMPILFTPRPTYTDRTPLLLPLLTLGVKALAVLGVEWTTLDFIEHAPVLVRVSTFVISIAVLAVIDRKSWLDFKGRYWFGGLLAGLVTAYGVVVGWSYVTFEKPVEPAAAVSATAAIPPRSASVPQPASLSVDEIQFRNDLRRFILLTLQDQFNALGQIGGELSSSNNQTPQQRLYLDQLFNGAFQSVIPVWNELRDYANVPIEKMDIKIIIAVYGKYRAAFAASANYTKDFLVLANADPNEKNNSMKKYLAIEAESVTSFEALRVEPLAVTYQLTGQSPPSSGDAFLAWSK
ncbi:MAG TPA: hypothetical protein VMF32_03460 [Xanthobacteraceae bacterium]|nr:hypothetical protein [Xanthobacteraceae bacterium]